MNDAIDAMMQKVERDWSGYTVCECGGQLIGELSLYRGNREYRHAAQQNRSGELTIWEDAFTLSAREVDGVAWSAVLAAMDRNLDEIHVRRRAMEGER